MTEPAKIPNDLPVARLNGKDWPVPELGPRILRRARAAIIAVNDAIIARRENDPDLPDDAATASAEFGRRTGERYAALSDALFGMMCDAVFWGLKAAHRDLPQEEFEEWPVTNDEMFAAYLVVRQQSGLFGRYRSVPAGEAVAANETSRSANQTGTD